LNLQLQRQRWEERWYIGEKKELFQKRAILFDAL
jgi:hypothetical protein